MTPNPPAPNGPPQLDLFADPRPPLPAANYTKTSRAAAHAIRESAATQRHRVLVFIVGQGERGATNDEIEVALRMLTPSVCGRRRELDQQGLIRDTGTTRPTRHGCRASVWVATERGVDAAGGTR